MYNLTVSYNKHKVLQHVSFDVLSGEIIGVIGENGSGKSTCFKSILGLKKCDEGQLLFEGRPIVYPSVYKNIGYVSDECTFYPSWTVENNLEFFLTSSSCRENIFKILKLVGLENKEKYKFSELSLGMKKRLNIARSLLNHPKLLIMDEPLNGLDPIGVRDFKDYIRQYIKNKKGALLISSHALKEMAFFCHKYILIRNGKIISIIKNESRIEEYNAYICYEKDDLNIRGIFKENEFFEVEHLSRIYFKYDSKKKIPKQYIVIILNKEMNILEDIYISTANTN